MPLAKPVPSSKPERQGDQRQDRQFGDQYRADFAFGKTDHPQRRQFPRPLGQRDAGVVIHHPKRDDDGKDQIDASG